MCKKSGVSRYGAAADENSMCCTWRYIRKLKVLLGKNVSKYVENAQQTIHLLDVLLIFLEFTKNFVDKRT